MQDARKILFRVTTVEVSLDKLLEGQLSYMNKHFRVVGVCSDNGGLNNISKREGIEVIPLNMTRSVSPFQDVLSIWKMYKLFVAHKPDIVHSHTPKAGLVSMMAGFFAGVPIRLHTVAGLPLVEHRGLSRMILILVEKLTHRLATRVYSNSVGLYDIMLSMRIVEKSKIKVLGNGSSNGVDIDYFNVNCISNEIKKVLIEKHRLEKNAFTFIFAGRIVKDKGINELVQAFQLLETLEMNKSRMSQKPIQLLLLGPFEHDLDPLRKSTREAIERNNNIIHVGFQRDVRPYFSISNVLILPSYREGFPNVVLQAGAMGIPSIVTDINGSNEIIREGVNGWIVPTKSTESLVTAMLQAMIKIVTDEMKVTTRSLIVQKYKREALWDLLLEEYNSMLDVQ